MKNSFKGLALVGISLSLAIGCGGNKEATEAPVEKVAAVEAEASSTPALIADIANGKTVYDSFCFACHMAGVAGAASIEDKPRWEEIAAKPIGTLHGHVINGFTGSYGVMPPKGTCMDCSEQDLYDAIHSMMDSAGVTPSL